MTDNPSLSSPADIAIVVVTYDENVLGRRLAAMQLPDEIRDLFRHALARVWREEEMHTLYIRGGLLKFRKPVLNTETRHPQRKQPPSAPPTICTGWLPLPCTAPILPLPTLPKGEGI